MKIIDNFLSNEEHRYIQDVMLNNEFPWFVSSIVLNDDSKELAHVFYRDYSVNSNYWNLVVPIINKVTPKALVRVRAALVPKGIPDINSGWHKDMTFNCTTAIYYVNSNDGYTLFEDGTKVESVANRFVYFDSQNKHTGVCQTDTDFRCLINFNYF